jgi:hypothetical protein
MHLIYPTSRHSILPMASVFIHRCGAVRRVELIPSGYNHLTNTIQTDHLLLTYSA